MQKRILSVFLVLVMAFTFIFNLNINTFAISQSDAKTLINGQKLYPQKTGYKALDEKVSSVINVVKKSSSDTYSTIKGLYDYLIDNTTYTSTSLYPYKDFLGDDYTVPSKIIKYSYGPLFNGEGLCNYYSSAFVVMLRALGLDAYMASGTFIRSNGTTNIHMWVLLDLDGEKYVFDPQADDSAAKEGQIKYYYFCKKQDEVSKNYRWDDKASDLKEFETDYIKVKDTAKPVMILTDVIKIGGGSVTESFWAEENSTVTIKATEDENCKFEGFYENDKLITKEKVLSYKIAKYRKIHAKFSNSHFADVKQGSWYFNDVNYVVSKGLFNGTSLFYYEPQSPMTRAMFVKVLAILNNANLDSYTTSKFTDNKEKSWYFKYVNWAAENDIIAGTSPSTFSPNSNITRQEMAVMTANYIKFAKYSTDKKFDKVTFEDENQIALWAKEAVDKCQADGVILGEDNNMYNPKGYFTRAQAASLFKRVYETYNIK